MEGERIVISSGFTVTPDAVSGRTFTTAFRGYDQSEVRSFLAKLSEEMVGAVERENELRQRLEEAEHRAAHPEMDEAVLTTVLGEHAARLLASAREQAAAIRAEAEQNTARMVRDAEAQINRVRSEADSLLARRIEEVDTVTAGIRTTSEAEAKARRDQARADAEAELQAARTQGKEMVAEAKALRERMLADLARRRQIGEVQLEQLRAARDRLLEAYGVVRRTLEEATEELNVAEAEARLAAEEVKRRGEADMATLAAGPAPPAAEPPAEDRPAPVADAARRAVATVAAATAAGAGEAAGPDRAGGAAAPGGDRPEDGPRSPADAPVSPPREPAEARGASGGRGAQAPHRMAPVTDLRDAGSGAGSDRPSRGRSSSTERGDNADDADSGLAGRVSPAIPSLRPARSSAVPAPGSRSWRPPSPGPGRGPETAGGRGGGAAATARRLEPVPDPRPPAATPAPAAEPAPGPVNRVDELFARIKADRMRGGASSGPVAEDSGLAPPPADDAAPPAQAAPNGAGQANGAERTAATAGDDTAGEAGEDMAGEAVPVEVSDERARARRDELLEPVEETLVRRLKRTLQDEQNEVLDRLRRSGGPHPEAVLPAESGRFKRLEEAASSPLADAARAGAGFGSGADPGSQTPDVGELASALAVEIASALTDRLERALRPPDGHEAGGRGGTHDDTTEIMESVSAIYRQWRTQEIEPLARHHVAVAFNRAAYSAAPEGATQRWVVDDDGPCPDCDDNALEDRIVKGRTFPTGQLHPPAHPGCRCFLVATVP